MKRIISFIISLILCLPMCVNAAKPYITLEEYPYSTHILGEDLIIYGDTNLSFVTIGLYYPDDEQNYKGHPKHILVISRDNLKNGYVIPTGVLSTGWPRGKWKVSVQNGEVKDSIMIQMEEREAYNRNIYFAEYKHNTLSNIKSYKVRGIEFKNNVISFTTDDGKEIRIFSWNNLSPADKGESKVFIAYYDDGYITEVKTYEGNLKYYDKSISIQCNDKKEFKLLYWDAFLLPIK